MKKIFLSFAASFIVCAVISAPVGSAVPIDAKSAFGIVASCTAPTDETAAINAAFAAAKTDEIYFSPGCYGTAGVDTFAAPIATRTAGVALTTFRNTSPTRRMFEFTKQGSTTGTATSFNDFGGFTLDQNGGTGDGILGGAQYSSLHDITVHGQAGAGFAFNLIGATLATSHNLNVNQSTNGFKLSNIYYLDATAWSCERSSGQCLSTAGVVQLNMRSLYLDNGGVPSSASAGALMSITGSFSVHIDNFSAEIGPGYQLSPLSFFLVQNSDNVNIDKIRLNHYPLDHASKCLFMSDNSSLNLRGIEWVESNNATTILACTGGPGAQAAIAFPNNAANRVLSIRDMLTNASGAGHFVTGQWGGTGMRFIAENWSHKGAITPSSAIDANEVSCKLLGPTALSYGAGAGRC